MKLDTLFKEKDCVFALEVFPPKRHSGIESVYSMLDEISGIPADYTSVTYSAGGDGAKEYTAHIAQRLKEKHSVEPLAHLTCATSTRDEVSQRLTELRQAGVENILALRGDKLPGVESYTEYTHASDLVAAIRREGGFYTVAACYPEGHPECDGLVQDVQHLRFKLEAGAGHLVSQLFFDNGRFFRFLNLARKHGIHCPVEAGVMPLTRPAQLGRIVGMSSASVPQKLARLVSRYEHDPDSFYAAGIDYAVEQCRDLIESGVDGVHLYAMNKPDVARKIYDGIADLL